MDPYYDQPAAATSTATQSTDDVTSLSPPIHRSASIRYPSDELSQGLTSKKSDFKRPSSVLTSSTIQLPHIFQSNVPDLSLPFKTQTRHDGYNIVGSSFEVESNRPFSQRPHSRWSDFYQVVADWWIFEVLACAGSSAALIGIIVVLMVYNGRSLPNWPYGITINSVMAWFTTAMKALMLVAITACISQAKWTHFHSKTHALADIVVYDSASRGPQGSIQLLWKFQARHVACLGALITILTIGIDPFVQQVISVKTRNVTSNYPPTLDRAQSFLQWDESAIGNEVTFDMLGAMYSGIFAGSGGPNEVSFGMNPSCPTGNCTFPLFQSLAVCHHCANITDTIEGNCQKGGKYPLWASICQYSLPNGLKLNVTSLPSFGSVGPVATSGYLGLVGATEFGNTLLNFTRISMRSYPHNMTAEECVLYWCVNTYEAKVVNGALDERVIQSWHSNSTEWHQINSDRLNSIWLGLNAPAIDDRSAASSFPVAYLAMDPLSGWLTPKMSVSNSEYATYIGNGSYSLGPDVTANQSIDTQDIIRVLWQPDIDALFSNLAASMTRNVREVDWETQTYGDGWLEPTKGVGTANGTAWALGVYIHVRWPWLILPITLVGLTILFLTLTVIETARSKVEVWKSSPVPLLFHGLENTEATRLQLAAQLVEMEIMAEKIPVRLEKTDTGWKLVR